MLGVLGFAQLASGLFALLAPRSFYDGFPFGGGWVAALPDYSEHLVRDVGGLFLATAVLLLAAAWLLDRRLVAIACVAYLAFSLPHAIYHYFNLDVYGTGDTIANAIALAATVVLPIWVLLMVLTGPAP